MSQDSKTNTTPNWILFLFFGTLIFGGLFVIYEQGFLKADASYYLHKSAGVAYEMPAKSEIAFKEFPPHNAASISEGQKHYEAACAACHAKDLSGGVGPNLKDSGWLHFEGIDVSEKNVAIRIIKGVSADQAKKGGVMPARGGSSLSNEEILKIAYYLASKNPSIKKSKK